MVWWLPHVGSEQYTTAGEYILMNSPAMRSAPVPERDCTIAMRSSLTAWRTHSNERNQRHRGHLPYSQQYAKGPNSCRVGRGFTRESSPKITADVTLRNASSPWSHGA